VAELGKPINLRAFMPGNLIFMGVFGNEEVRRINAQVKDGYETILYMHSLDPFQKPYVGNIDRVEIIDEIKENDPLIPDYYFRVIEDRSLRPHYSITLTGIDEATSLELRDVIPLVQSLPSKYHFPYPMLVSQRLTVTFFDHDTPKIGEIEAVYGREPVSGRRCWYLKQPEGRKPEKPLTLGEREIALLKCFKDEKSGIYVASIVKKIYESRRKNPKSKSKNVGRGGTQYIQDLVSKINKKFKGRYERDLIKNIRAGGMKKKYFLQVSKIIFTDNMSRS
jgi:hypothetical protein